MTISTKDAANLFNSRRYYKNGCPCCGDDNFTIDKSAEDKGKYWNLQTSPGQVGYKNVNINVFLIICLSCGFISMHEIDLYESGEDAI